MKNEREFTVAFGKWVNSRTWTKTAVFELKHTKKSSFYYGQWKKRYPHQPRYLFRAKENYVYHKISDQSSETKKFDSFLVVKADAYLVIWFEPEKCFAMIPIEEVEGLTDEKNIIRFFSIPSRYVFQFPKKKKEKKPVKLLNLKK